MAKAAVVVGMCGGVLTGSNSKRGVGSMVAVGTSGNGRWCWMVAGGVALQALGIRKGGRGRKTKMARVHSDVGRM